MRTMEKTKKIFPNRSAHFNYPFMKTHCFTVMLQHFGNYHKLPLHISSLHKIAINVTKSLRSIFLKSYLPAEYVKGSEILIFISQTSAN